MVTLLFGSAVFPEAMLMLIAFVPLARIEEMQHPSMVIDFVMVTAPKPPGSSASISPPTAVFEMAPAKVLQGAVRLHGLAASPTPETQVRLAWALAIALQARITITIEKAVTTKRDLVMVVLLSIRRAFGSKLRTIQTLPQCTPCDIQRKETPLTSKAAEILCITL